MKFEEIIPALKDGKKIKRKWWRDRDYIRADLIFSFGQVINEINEIYALTIWDLEADDWETVEE